MTLDDKFAEELIRDEIARSIQFYEARLPRSVVDSLETYQGTEIYPEMLVDAYKKYIGGRR